MPRNITSLALLALIAIVAATVAALAGSDIVGPNTRPTRTETEQRRSQPPTQANVEPVVDLARGYALASRNWTPATYEASWARQVEFAGGSYRRALINTRPGRRELVALREDRASSSSRVLRVERDRRVRLPDARVLVTLNEITTAGSQTIRGATLNEVRLRRRGGQWQVVGWTVIPGG